MSTQETPSTPGQLAYEAYWRVHLTDGLWHVPPAYATLQPVTQQRWEAAAHAVRTHLRVELVAAMRPLRPAGAGEEDPYA